MPKRAMYPPQTAVPLSLPKITAGERTVQKSTLLATLKTEIQRHDFSSFVDEPPSVAEAGRYICTKVF
jgi:hypothetical protein